jgi:2-keto-4-pentenoate hydratase/2-oxohepta-3-ene-1,7-dioic acid hydratase in catechol pathway
VATRRGRYNARAPSGAPFPVTPHNKSVPLVNTVTVDGRVIAPSKIVCVGRNYVAHIEELGNEVPEDMVVFLKPNSAIGTELRARHGEAPGKGPGETLHYEAELAFVVENAQLVAVGLGLDLTRRELQSQLKAKGLPWERAKAFDGAALFSEFVPLPASGLDGLALELDVDGVPRQRGGIELMLYPPATVLEQLEGFMHLEDGDILMTGTPAGVGAVRAGETFSGRVVAGGRTLVTATWRAG